MAAKPSRNLEGSADLAAGNCPRCGVRLAQTYKYCPNCAYRLRPDLAPESGVPPRKRTPLADRLIALGGYLAFASILLLVTLVGFRLFDRPAAGPNTTSRTVRPGDNERNQLDPDSFATIASGYAPLGLYDDRSYDSGNQENAPPPVREYYVDDAFRMTVHEITNDQYYEFLDAWTREARQSVPRWMYPDNWRTHTGGEWLSRIYSAGDANLPVTGVFFAAAREFCAWYWQVKLQKDPDRIVDLPTWREYLRAARPTLEHNFPWGESLGFDAPANLSGRLLKVDDPRVGRHGDLFALVGNAAEWVHGWGHGYPPLAGGWSWQDPGYLAAKDGNRLTPFDATGFRVEDDGTGKPDVGFRIVIRNAPAQPDFRHEVDAGPVHLGESHPDLMPPLVEDGTTKDEEGDEEENGEPERLPLVTFANRSRRVERRFRIARTAITNRQYLAYLVDRATTTPNVLELPKSWSSRHPFSRREQFPTQFAGPYGPPSRIPFFYAPGTENQPVVAVTKEQIDAYAAWLTRREGRTCRIPTVEEFVRAGRGQGAQPYPWGDLDYDLSLFSAETHPDRPVSILGRLAPAGEPVVGLVGNVCEYVTDGSRRLLAGGFYKLPARLCTLDTFLDANWKKVWYRQHEEEPPLAGPFAPAFHAGFRIVQVREFP